MQGSGAMDEENMGKSNGAAAIATAKEGVELADADAGEDEHMPLTYESRRNRMRRMTMGEWRGLQECALLWLLCTVHTVYHRL